MCDMLIVTASLACSQSIFGRLIRNVLAHADRRRHNARDKLVLIALSHGKPIWTELCWRRTVPISPWTERKVNVGRFNEFLRVGVAHP